MMTRRLLLGQAALLYAQPKRVTVRDAAAIQNAIDDCSRQGGGVVVLPAGRYLTGTLVLKNNVTLHLEEGARLLGSTNFSDYRNVDGFTDGTGSAMGYCLIAAVDAVNIGITGAGVIDGQGRELLAAVNKDRNKRPFLARFVRCRGVSMSGVRLESPAAWTVHFFQCRTVTADGVTINSHAGSNNDGFDIDSCQNVRLRNCNIDTGDDAICLKTTSPEPCRDVSISDCTLQSNCAALKIGTESIGDVSAIRVEHCRILYAGLGGIKLLTVDGAHLSDVVVDGIIMESGRVAVFLRLGARLKTFRSGDAKREPGSLSSVRIANVQANVEGTGVMISGVPGHLVEDVTIENVDLSLPGGGSEADAQVQIPEVETAYPEIRMFGPVLPAYGVWARHVKGLQVRGLKVTLARTDGRPERVVAE